MSALAIALPLLGMAVRRWQTAAVTGADGLRAPAMVAVLIAVLCASMPWAWLLGVAIAVTALTTIVFTTFGALLGMLLLAAPLYGLFVAGRARAGFSRDRRPSPR